MGRPWLLVGALPVETGPVVAALSERRLLSTRMFGGRLGGVEVVVLTCGVGPKKAGRRTAAVLDGLRPGRVVSFGTCGALVDELEVGARVSGKLVRADEEEAVAVDPLFDLRPTRVVTVSTPVWKAERRAHYAALGDEVCEMEAAAVLQAARAWDPAVPVHALKIVSDQAGGKPDPALGRPRETRPVVIGRFMVRAKRLCSEVLVPRLTEGLAASRVG